jgi:hypothetical protein
MDMIKLRAPRGTDECNYGTERYRVDNDGCVVVPVEAARHLVGAAGFVIVLEQEPSE